MISKDKKKTTKATTKKEQLEFKQNIVEVRRVTRVMAGGKRLSFRACVVIGDHNGRVGLGIAKAKDVPLAVQKAIKQAEKKLIKINLREGTITHEVKAKFGSARIFLKPAPPGTGIISGGAVRIVLELVGVENIVSKIFGTNNKINNIKATLKALTSLKKVKISKKEEKNNSQENNKEREEK